MVSLPCIWAKYTMYTHPRARNCARITPLACHIDKSQKIYSYSQMKKNKKVSKKEILFCCVIVKRCMKIHKLGATLNPHIISITYICFSLGRMK